MSPLILLAIALMLTGYLLWSRRHLYYLSWKFGGRWGYPIVGSAFDFMDVTDFGEYLESIWGKYNSPCVIWLGGKLHIAIRDAEYMQLVLTCTDIMDKHSIYEVYHPVGGKHSLNFAKGDLWKFERRIMNPILNLINVNKFIPSFNMIFEKLNVHLKNAVNKGEVDIYEDFIQTVIGLSFETIAGKNLDWYEKKTNISFHHALKIVQDNIDIRTNKVLLHNDFIYQFTNNYKETTAVMEKLLGTLQSMIIENASTEGLEFTRPGDAIMDIIRKNLDKPGFANDDAKYQILNLIVASFETMGYTIYMTLFYMALYPDLQEKLYDELRFLFPNKNFNIDVNNLNDLVYTEMVINEVMRLHPPIPLIGRTCTKDTYLRNGTFIPKGVEFLIDLVGLQRNKTYWGPNSDKFNPENFRPENKETRHPNVFTPFSIGTRNCIGARYAKISMRIIIAKVFRNFRLETPHIFEDLKYKRGTAMQIITPVKFRVFERSD